MAFVNKMILLFLIIVGHKVGRVEQAETALGAEMRMAAEKAEQKGKTKSGLSAEKIVRRYVHISIHPKLLLIYCLYRELNKVYTNGTLVDGELLTDEQAGHCVSITESAIENGDSKSDVERKFGVCILDCSTSEFNLSCFEDDVCRTKLETLMRQIRPKEILYKKVSIIFPAQVNSLNLSRFTG